MMIRIMFAGDKRYPLILQWILYFYYCGGSFTIFWWIGKFSLCSILLPLSNTSCQCYLDRWHSCQPCFRQVETRMYQKAHLLNIRASLVIYTLILLPLSNTSCQRYLDRWHSCQPRFRQLLFYSVMNAMCMWRIWLLNCKGSMEPLK